MYKVYFDESFFDWLNYFVSSMKNYYSNFYSNTGLYDEEKIVEWYFEKYEKMKTDIFNDIHNICENWIIWRKMTYVFEKIENCSFIFKYWNYTISFTAIKNDLDKKIIVNTLRIEI